jgi:NAD(P)-dependent dehydrogenase (short-subunit alcohol dehydrogenase family)
MESNEFKLQERTALVTGPCTSVVQSIATTLTQLGCSVVMADTNVDSHQRFAERLLDAREIHDRYGRAATVNADFSSLKGVQDTVSRAAQTFGGIDIYIDGLNAFDQKNFRDDGALSEMDQLLLLNLRAPLMITQTVLRFLEGRKRGRIVYLLHDVMRLGIGEFTVASAARGGLIQLARSLARETLKNKVTVNCLAVGISEELLLSFGKNKLSIQAAQSELLKRFPEGQITEPERVAQTVAFLASSMGSAITGQTIAVSQGLSFLG